MKKKITEIEPAVLSINQLMSYTGLGRVTAAKFGEEAGALIRLSDKRKGYLKERIDRELVRRIFAESERRNNERGTTD